MRFVKKPVEVEAICTLDDDETLLEWLRKHNCPFEAVGDHAIVIHTLEGDMRADKGDWIIRGVAGEFYPCKPHIFVDTYEPVHPDPATGWPPAVPGNFVGPS